MVHYTAELLAALCARTLEHLQADNVVTLDLRGIDSSPADYFMICTANSDVHARALGDAVTRTADSAGHARPRVEGRDAAEWVLLDFFDVVVHIFRGEAREYYKLEKLWGDAPRVDIIQRAHEQQQPASARARSAAKRPTTKTAQAKTDASRARKAAKKAPTESATAKSTTAKGKATTKTKRSTKTASATTATKRTTAKRPAASSATKPVHSQSQEN
jgi:ribosome-associated protein